MLLDLEAAALGSGVSVRTLRRWAQRGWIEVVSESELPSWQPRKGRPRCLVDLVEVERTRDYVWPDNRRGRKIVIR